MVLSFFFLVRLTTEKVLYNFQPIHTESFNEIFISNLLIEPESSTSNEIFDKYIGDIRIEDCGCVAVHGSSLSSGEVRGKQEYSSGKRKLRLKIERNPSRTAIIIGIISKSTPIRSNSQRASSFYGWASTGHYYRCGFLQNSVDPFLIYANNENDIIALTINADDQSIQYTNERTTDTKHLNIDTKRCPFPWQLSVNLAGDNDQLRILSYSNSLYNFSY